MQRIANGCIRSIRSTSEEVCLALLDSSGIAYHHFRRSRGLHLEGQVHGAIATATDLLQGIGDHRIRRQLLTAEQIGLSGLYRGGISSRFRRSEEQVQMNRTIAERVRLIRHRGGQWLASEQVRTGAAHSSRVLRVHGCRNGCTEERQQG